MFRPLLFQPVLFFLFYRIFYVFTFQMLSPFPVPSSPVPPPPDSMRILPLPPTHSHLTTLAFIPLYWGNEPSQDQELLLLLMPDKAILCYICDWSYGSLHVFSLVGGLDPEHSGGSVWLILLFFLWGWNPLQLLQFFLYLLHFGPCAQSDVSHTCILGL